MGAIVGLAFGVGLALLVSLRAAPKHTGRSSSALRPLRDLVAQAGVAHGSVGALIGACAGVGSVIGILAFIVTAVPMVGLLAAGAAGALPIILLRRRAAVRSRAMRSAWPDAVDQLVSGVRAGMSLPEALASLGQRGPDVLRPMFIEFAHDYRSTGSFRDALDNLQSALADPVADRVLHAIAIGRDVGGTDLGTVLRTVSALLREDERTRGEIESRQSWTVAAARLAVAAPWITLALLCTRPEAVMAYRSVGGAVVLICSALLSLVAYRVMLAIGRLPQEQRSVRT